MKKTKLTHVFGLLLVLMSSGQAQIQKNNNHPATINTQWSFLEDNIIQTIGVKQVPERITRQVIEDSQGHIWIASWDGVFKYNGMLFQNITQAVSDARFFDIMEDSHNNFWMATVGSGVFHFDGKFFKNYNTSNGLINNRVTNIYEDHAGQIWFGTEGGVSIFDGTSFHHLTSADGLPDNRINSVVEDVQGKYWIATQGKAAIYDPLLKSFTTISDEKGQFFENVRQIKKDSKGALWLAGSNGLWRYENFSFTQYTSAFTAYAFEDKSGNIMVSSSSINPNVWEINSFPEATMKPNQILEEQGMIFGILKDSKGQIWYGTLNGLKRYDEGTIYHYVLDKSP